MANINVSMANITKNPSLCASTAMPFPVKQSVWQKKGHTFANID